MKLNPKKFLIIQFRIFLILLILHLSSLYLVNLFPNYTNEFGLFNFDMETNIPTFFSSINLLICSFFCLIIYKIEKKSVFNLLSLFFLFASLDESILIHERITVFITDYLNIYFGWGYLYLLCIITFCIKFKQIFNTLPNNIRRLVSASLFIFLSGSIGFEFISFIFEPPIHIGLLFCTIEESLEMSGVILFGYTLLKYLKQKHSVYYLIYKD